jgi:hypothetical protein
MLFFRKLKKGIPSFVFEVVVILIGILLSLWISNWFQNRQDHRKEVRYLQRVKADLIDDLDRLKSDYQLRNMQLAFVKQALESVNEPDKEVDFANLGFSLQQLIPTIRFAPKEVTFRSLESTGRLGLIENQAIVAGLIGLYSGNYENVALNNEDINNYRDNFLLPYLLNELDFNGSIYQGKTETLANILTDHRFANHLIYEESSIGSAIYVYKKTIAAVEELIRVIEGELG